MPPLAGSLRARAAGHGRRRRDRWRLRRDQRRPRAGPARGRGHAAGGAHARLGRLDAERRHRPRRLQVERPPAHQALRRRDRQGALPGDARLLRAGQATDRGGGDRLRLPRGRPPRARLCARRTSPSSSTRGRAWRRSACSSTVVPRERIREEIGTDAYFGALAVEGSGLLHPGRYFAGLVAAADARRRGPARRRPRAIASGAQGDGRFVVETTRGADPRAATCSSPRTATRTASSRRSGAGSSRSARTSSRREPLPEDLAHELSPKGRSFFDTKNFLYYWHVSADRRMIFGGRASFMPTSIDHTARDPPPRAARGPPAAGRLPDRVRLGRQRRLHVRPDAARRADEGRRHVRDGLLRDGRRADDQPRDAGRASGWRVARRRP